MNTPRFLQRLALNIWNSKRRYDKFMCGASTASGHSKSENLVIVMNSEQTCHSVRAVTNNYPRLDVIRSQAL